MELSAPGVAFRTACFVAAAAFLAGAAVPASAEDAAIQASPGLVLCNATDQAIEATIALGEGGAGPQLKESLAPHRCSQLSLPADLATPLTVSGTGGGRAFKSLSFQSNGKQQRVRFVDTACRAGDTAFCVAPRA